METRSLKTFLTVARTGSFTRAASESFLSSMAVMKQVNRLEREMGVRLFTRSSKGARLTPAGEVFLTYAKTVSHLTQEIYERCHQGVLRNVIRLGTSLLHPSAPFMPEWERIKKKMPGWSLKIVRLPDDLSENREYSQLGRVCDIMIGTFDEATIRSLVTAIPLGSYKFGIAVRPDSPLAGKKSRLFSFKCVRRSVGES